MSKVHRNPSGIAEPPGYSHVVEVTSGRLVLISGQVAYDEAGNLVGEDDHAAQARQVYTNLKTALAEVGATPADLVKTNTYVVDYSPALLPGIKAAASEIMGFDPPPTSTLVGVTALARPSLLIEVEGMAVVD